MHLVGLTLIYIQKNCVSSWSFTKNHNKMHGQQNIKFCKQKVSSVYHFLHIVLYLQRYLCHVCHYLEKQGMMNVLYQLQVHLHDYVRAAMTCIRFYLKGARNYSDLASNIEHLRVAQKHLEVELQTAHQGTSSRASSGICLSLTLSLSLYLSVPCLPVILSVRPLSVPFFF